MSNYSSLKATIDANIKANDNQEITGVILNSVLNDMVDTISGGYLYKGVASPSTNPGSPDEKVFYVAPPGTYSHFNNLVVPAATTGFLKWDTAWHLETVATGVADGSVTKAKLATSLANEIYAGYVYGGLATPTGNPGTIIRDSFFLTSAPGIYTNYGGQVVGDEEIGILKYSVSSSSWSKEILSLPSIPEIVDNFYDGGSGKVLSAEAGKYLNQILHNGSFTLGTSDAMVHRYPGGEPSYSRIRLIYYIPFVPASLQASCTLGKGVAISVYDSLQKARINAQDYIISPTNYGYVSSYSGTLTKGGYVSITLAKASGNFSESEIAAYIAATTIQITQPSGGGGEVRYLQDNVTKLSGMGLSLEDMDLRQTQGGSSAETPTGNRLRLICYVPDMGIPVSLFARCTRGKGVAASVYNSFEEALLANPTYLQTISYSYKPTVFCDRITPGYLVITLAKTDDSSISAEDKEELLRGTTIHIATRHQMSTILAKDELLNWQKLELRSFSQKSMTQDALSDNNASKRVSLTSKLSIPYLGGYMRFVLPEQIAIAVRSGSTIQNLSNNDFWMHNDDIFKFVDSAEFFRICFSKNDGADELPLSEIENYITLGQLQIWISTELEQDIIKRNYETEKYVKAVMRNFVSGQNNNGSLTKLPIFGHSSDFHGDMWRARSFLRYCDYLGVDAALISGDMAGRIPDDSSKYIADLGEIYTTPIAPCIGNHDAMNLYSEEGQSEMLRPMIDKLGASYSATYPTYYYKDFTAKNIRLIALNFYEAGHSGEGGCFTQTQCEWLISTLLSTPANYGILVMFHAPETTIDMDANYPDFYQKLKTYWGLVPDISGTPVSKIMDAFIAGSSFSVTYTSAGTSITVTGDFSTKKSGVEFIAYVNGHEHSDSVGYVNGTTHKQLNLNVCCGIAIYFNTYHSLADLSDLPRGDSGSTQDAFNIYAIDRAAKKVRIAKVGSNLSGYDLQERKYMAIPYAE